jgi:Xaa-Pro aminopeptidase
VFALDPQLWVPDEQLYMRVEDTVAVTADGVESLTGACPLDLDEIEQWMAGPSLLEAFPPLTVPPATDL